MPDAAKSDPLAKLKALTKSSGGDNSFAHESEADVIRRLLGIFTRVPTGQRLMDMANQYGIAIKLMKGTVASLGVAIEPSGASTAST